MSTSLDRDKAMFYAQGGADKSKKGKPSILFEMQMGMIDRGADISWASQFPHEVEILFAPLTGLELLRLRVEGRVLVAEVRTARLMHTGQRHSFDAPTHHH